MKSKFWQKLKTDRKTQIITIVVAVVIILGGTILVIWAFNRPQEEQPAPEEEKKFGYLVPRKIDGVLVSGDQSNLFPVGVMIENLSTVRPQYGIGQANLVFETLAEGGITRFLVIFAGGQNLDQIGPVRSIRPYYLEWAKEFDLMLMHCGGSYQALQMVAPMGIKAINQITEGQYYWRGPGSAPHNLFTNTEKINFSLRDKGWADLTPKYESWRFRDEEGVSSRPEEEKYITLDFSTPGYEVRYTYDRDKNVYLRENGGQPHQDALTGEQIAVKNVAVQKVESKTLDAEGRLDLDVLGEGQAIIFSNGQAEEGTWKKEGGEYRTKFYDSQGEEYQFDRGVTWIETIPTDRKVDYN